MSHIIHENDSQNDFLMNSICSIWIILKYTPWAERWYKMVKSTAKISSSHIFQRSGFFGQKMSFKRVCIPLRGKEIQSTYCLSIFKTNWSFLTKF